MSIITEVVESGKLIRVHDMKPTIIMLSSAVLLALHRSFGSPEFASRLFQHSGTFAPVLYMFVCAFALMGMIPLLLVTSLFHERVEEYGVCLGNARRGLASVAILAPLIAALLLLPASRTEEMRLFYPWDKHAADSPGAFLQLQLTRGIFFYTAWEFFFRGFMLFGLRKHVGDWLAVCIQTIPSCLWHIGMPTGEIFSSIAAGSNS